MVWFQCEDCGDNLKKPKLPNHFRICSASKLSCIDCGQVFGQQTVESHTQCISEAEKYGPKGQGKSLNGVNAKTKDDSKPKPDFDVNVGLSERPPWFCSLCNTKATSRQTLLLHAEGKKHGAKARAFHAAKQQPKDAEETKASIEKNVKNDIPDNKNLMEPREPNSSKVAAEPNGSGVEKSSSQSSKKRKLEASETNGARKKAGGDMPPELGNGEVIQVERSETKETKGQKKSKRSPAKEDEMLDSSPNKENGEKKIKWKKLITSALKSNPDGVLKFKKLRKLVLKSLEESGSTKDKSRVSEMLEQKVNSSSRFTVDGKYVSLAATS
ncbi:zinc ion binding [Forsythia ovata]|uniref:Zinc ion binding n=1 Tax=Forsythia ovata TaxID=205694 RepID=A0ABD1WWH9_9LAMI